MDHEPTPQHFRDVTVSRPNRRTKSAKPTVAISTDVMNYVQLDEDRLRWLVEEAGPKALEMLRHA